MITNLATPPQILLFFPSDPPLSASGRNTGHYQTPASQPGRVCSLVDLISVQISLSGITVDPLSSVRRFESERRFNIQERKR